MLEIFNNQFAGIAEQMGITLRNTSSSVNVKERLDFSCAIFTPPGDLVVNAPHIPVHLGAMGETVKRILADNPQICSPATCSSPTIPIAAARTCPTSRWSRRCTTSGRASCCSSPPAGPIMRRSAASPRLDAAVLAQPGRRRRVDSQLQARRRRAVADGRVAMRCCCPAPYPTRNVGGQPGRRRGPGRRQPSRRPRPGAA